jgi:transaldolase/glucose-6-phosphate isomerase
VAGVNLSAFIDDALMMQKLLKERGDDTNPALLIGGLMAAGAEQKCDKLTVIASKRSAPLVPWIEQLVAESTGKEKKGVIPIEAEPSAPAAKYAKDRLFVFLKMTGERTLPAVEITLGSVHELGRQFLLWEAATAVTGCLMRINPFDEPNVTESKNNTTAILAAFERAGELPFPKARSTWGRLSLVAHAGVSHQPRHEERLTHLLKRFFRGAKPPRYFSLLNYFQCDKKCEASLDKIRRTVRDRTGMATLRGYGPRYLHSIGQLYKGGPQTGMFVVFVRSDYGHLPIPGKPFGFAQLIAAQSIGDAQALISRNLPTLVFAIDGSPSAGLASFARALGAALK